MGEKKLSNTNLVVSRRIKRENASLPVDVRRSKTSLLKLPSISVLPSNLLRFVLFSLQGLGQDMFAFFFDLGVPSVYRIDGKLINNFASDAFLGELVSLISSLCPDLKPKIYRETPL